MELQYLYSLTACDQSTSKFLRLSIYKIVVVQYKFQSYWDPATLKPNPTPTMGMTKNSMGLAVLAAMFSPATASLRACSDIGCNPVCEVNNEVLSSVGTTKFISAAYASEMEWTVGIVNATSPLRKNYYLASMPGLSLSNATGLGGCALIFNGIESKLKFANATGYEYDNGQCSDALKANCESDLLRQARVMAANMTSSGALRCGDLAQSLQNNPPKSCEIGTNWGTITAKGQSFLLTR